MSYNGGATKFCILLEVVKSIGIDSAAKSLSWSVSSVRKSAGFAHFHFTKLNSVGNQRQQLCPVGARKYRRRNSRYPYRPTRPYLSCQGFSLQCHFVVHEEAQVAMR